ncbi:MAG: hypothetical protein WA821_22630 [Anaerolineales bacterium]
MKKSKDTPEKILGRLLKIRQDNVTWLCTVRRAPFWEFPKNGEPARPFFTMVYEPGTDKVMNTHVTPTLPDTASVMGSLVEAMQGSILTLMQKKRPDQILIDNAELAQALAPQLAPLNIRCSYRSQMPELRDALIEMETYLNGREPIPGILSIPGVTVPLAAELHESAAAYYKLKPWRWIENWDPIEIRFPPEGRARYALLLGGGGETFGLSLYESLADVNLMLSGANPKKRGGRSYTWLSLVLDEATAMSMADLDAIDQYGWPIAAKKAYPLVFKATEGKDDWGNLPNASELTWLAAALCALPSFLKEHLHADRGRPLHRQAVAQLTGVYGNQQIFLRYPAEENPPEADFMAVVDAKAKQLNAPPDEELEEYIEDWYSDDESHEYARQVGAFLFRFFEYLETTGLSRATMHKHESNCWCIGWLECDYGYHDVFTPAIFKGGPSFITEFEEKISDSTYALKSYEATWRKLEKYVESLEK